VGELLAQYEKEAEAKAVPAAPVSLELPALSSDDDEAVSSEGEEEPEVCTGGRRRRRKPNKAVVLGGPFHFVADKEARSKNEATKIVDDFL
jgi:hypothetical protein